MPAEAGIQSFGMMVVRSAWIPAFAGMTINAECIEIG